MTDDEKIKKYRVSYTKVTNNSTVDGNDEFPVVPCYLDVIPDYLCLYGDPKDYNKTNMTCVCFYEFDSEFDGINGLFNAIYYENEKLLDFYKDRFKNVRMVVEPDYSQIRDIELIENKYRQFKARVVSLWFINEMNIPVIPNLNYAGEYSMEYMLDGIKEATMISVSLKGIMDKECEEELLIKAIKNAVDNLPNLKKIICFSTSPNDDKNYSYFKYAKDEGIEVVIPHNSMRLRNMELSSKN